MLGTVMFKKRKKLCNLNYRFDLYAKEKLELLETFYT